VKIIRCPLRVSLWGGGTDLPEYYKYHRSIFFSFAINRYMYVVYNERPTGGYRVSYSEVEELEDLKDAKHTLIAELGRRYSLSPCTLTIVSDVPKGTGLGSSSAISVCLLKLAGYAADKPPIWKDLELAQEAFHFERASGAKVGRQDHLPAVMGEFCEYRIDMRGSLRVFFHPLMGTMMGRYGMLLYTGISRQADKVLLSWEQQVEKVQQIHEIAMELSRRIEGLGRMILPSDAAKLLRRTWEVKRSIPGVVSDELNEQYEKAIAAGALAGKLCGAGAGGCWFFMVDNWNRDKVKDALGLPEIPFKVVAEGIKEWHLEDGLELAI
jgi:D-glycero-alpha-D-manno-heptose-7-phosphate kinase